MSYCVNCGVELETTEKKCPLCDTVVLNPRSPWMPPESDAYPQTRETVDAVASRRYIALLLSVLMCVPILVVLVCDIVSTSSVSWSLYAIGALSLFFVFFILPMFFKRYIIPVFLLIDCLAMSLYTLLIETLVGGIWFLQLALPLCVASCGFAILWSTLFKNKKVTTLLVRTATALFSLGVFIVLVELIINAYIGDDLTIRWSQYVLIPCAVLTLAFVLMDSRKGVKEALRRRMFIR